MLTSNQRDNVKIAGMDSKIITGSNSPYSITLSNLPILRKIKDSETPSFNNSEDTRQPRSSSTGRFLTRKHLNMYDSADPKTDLKRQLLVKSIREDFSAIKKDSQTFREKN